MKKRLFVLIAAGVVFAATASAANAATVVVAATNCALVHGGQATVPAGSTVTVRMGFAEETRGILEALLEAQTTSLTVNGSSTDVSNLFSAPYQRPNGSWATDAFYDTTITLAAGQSLTFTQETTFSHAFPEVLLPTFDSSPGVPVMNAAGPQPPLTCTVTGV